MPNINNQGDEWQVQVSKRKKNNQRKQQKKNQKYSSKEQVVNKNKRDSSYYYQTTKKNKEQNGNKNKNGKRSNKFENKMKKQNRGGKDNILDNIPIERNKNLNVVKSTSLLKIQIERQQNSQRDNALDLNSKDLIVPKKTMSEISDETAVSVTSLASDTNSMTSSVTQTNSLIKEQINSRSTDVTDKKNVPKDKLSETTLLDKESECSSRNKEIESASRLISPITHSISPKSSSSITINAVNTTGIICQKKEGSEEKENKKDEIIKRLESQCSLSSSSSVTSFDSNASSKSESSSGDDNESVITAKNETDDVKIPEKKKENEKEVKKEENKKVNTKDDMTKKVLEFNFKNYTDVKPFIPKHLKAQQEQAKVEAPKPQTQKYNSHIKNTVEKKHYENENAPVRKTKEINKIIRIDPSCLHQKDGHIVPIPAAVLNMKNGKNHTSVQEILQRNIQQKAIELQESKKKKFDEMRKSLDDDLNRTQGYQSLPIRENNNAAKKTEEKVAEKVQVRKAMSNSTLEVSSVKNSKEHQRTSSYTMSHSSMMQKTIPNFMEYRDECHSICNRIENEYNNVRCYNDPMEQSLTRVKPASIKRANSVQNITTTLSKKGSNHQLLLGSGGCMTITNTITTCKTVPRIRSRSFSWLKGVRTDLDNTHVTTINTTTTTSHTNTLYTKLVGSPTYYPIVVIPTSSVQELSVETTSGRLRNSNTLPGMMGKLLRKFTWPFGGTNLETETPLAVSAK